MNTTVSRQLLCVGSSDRAGLADKAHAAARNAEF